MSKNNLKNLILQEIKTEHNLSKIKNNCYKSGFEYNEIDLEIQFLFKNKVICIINDKVYLSSEFN